MTQQSDRINSAGAYVIRSIDGPSRRVTKRVPLGYMPTQPTGRDRQIARAVLAAKTGDGS